MLRIVENRAPHLDVITGEVASPGEIFRAFRSLLRRQRWVILFAVAFAIGLAAVYVATTPPSFTALAKLIIDSRKVQLFSKESSAPTEDLPPDSQEVDSQVEILRSDQIARAVIRQFHLTEDPQFIGPGAGLFGGLVGPISDWRDRLGYGSVESNEQLTQRAVKAFADAITVTRVRLTSVLEVSFSAGDRQRAADIANAIANAYIEGQQQAKSDAAKRAGAWLQDRIKELSEQAAAAQRAVVEFKTKNNIVTVESVTGTGQRLLNEQRLGELSSQLVLARTNTADAKAHLDRIEEIISQGVPDGTVTDTLKNDVVSKLRSQYLDLKAREADWSARYGADHLAAINLRNQMGEIRDSIVAELQRLAETYKSDYEIAKQRESSIEAELGGAVSQSHVDSQAQIELSELQSNAQTYRALHDNFVQRYMEAVQQESFPITEARLIAPASPPLKKSSPRTLLALAIAGAAGLLFGLGVGQLREFLDRVFRTRSQVESKLRTDCIAIVPELAETAVKASRPARAVKASARRQAKKDDANDAGPRNLMHGQDQQWHVIGSPFSRFTEAMRAIKIAIDLKEAGKPNKVIAFTSTLPNEGKSTIAASLAQLIAHAGLSTILVDCDLRNPSLTRLLAPEATTGFFDLIKGDAELEDVVWVDQSTGLEFLPQATKTRSAHTDEALSSEATTVLFDKLRERYEYILVDCSPLTPVVDVRAMSLFVDSYVYVIEWGHTRFDVVEHALNDAGGVYEKLVGAVLNKVDVRALGRYDGYGASYYYNKHYKKYGYVT
jgi:succinoglycan biosynthesis transport protein ExoP